MTYPSFSNHAERRAQQRGVPHHLIKLILSNYDTDFPVGGNCRVLRVSRKLATNGCLGIGKQDVSRISRLAILHSDRSGKIVTVLHDESTRRGKRYRRQWN